MANLLCFIVIHTQKEPNLCFTYQHFCIAIAFFLCKIVVILNKTSIFAVCYYNTRCNKQEFELKFSQQ